MSRILQRFHGFLGVAFQYGEESVFSHAVRMEEEI